MKRQKRSAKNFILGIFRFSKIVSLFIVLFAANLSPATYASIAEVEAKVISFDDKNVVIEQQGERMTLIKSTIQNPKDIKVGKTVILKVKNDSVNRVELPRDYKPETKN